MKIKNYQRTPNTIGIYAENLHIVIYRPKNENGKGSAWGFHIRRRLAPNHWRHYLLRLLERAEPIPGGIGCWTCEAQRYDTRRSASDGSKGNRLTIKQFIRIKFGLGGKIPE